MMNIKPTTIKGRGQRKRKQQLTQVQADGLMMDFAKDVIKGGTKIVKKLQQIKPATKALQALENPFISAAFDQIPYSANIKTGLKIAKKAGFGKRVNGKGKK